MASSGYKDVKTECREISDYSQLKRGDQLAVYGKASGIVGYYHHGIYLGNGKVADYGGDKTKSSVTVRIISIDEFTDHRKRTLVRIEYPEGGCLPPEEAAREAEELAKNPRSMGSYHLLKNNCEHFATRCKTGYAVSKQVIETIRFGLAKIFGIDFSKAGTFE